MKVFETFTEFYTKSIKEDHTPMGTKVKLADGRLGIIQAWNDATGTYTVAIEGGAETVEIEDADVVIVTESDIPDVIEVGSKVQLSDGRIGTISAYTEADGKYTVNIEGDDNTEKCDKEDLTLI